jgi:hypothetical protein
MNLATLSAKLRTALRAVLVSARQHVPGALWSTLISVPVCICLHLARLL